ncbi:anaerobic benzoate catabolism transcriptional regulator [Brevundimonas sp. SH203]|uniref:helix-turn-helix domain-containing protein n=1 Tax=Brevundimonas sp. SH203 TaxID=345167 RepID=UPI0009CF5D38|nr:helix-turn-helix transcriptional regulator [Brevundimonas sp. SH203]GAW41505.1 anaerobic benzoate catabolism transcriptional regulator [Brevundimonas sp. SH203]
MLIGRNVRRHRVAKGLTQEELSARCDFDQRYISQVENGLQNLTVLSLYELSQALDTTPVALVTPDEEAARVG